MSESRIDRIEAAWQEGQGQSYVAAVKPVSYCYYAIPGLLVIARAADDVANSFAAVAGVAPRLEGRPPQREALQALGKALADFEAGAA